METHPYESEPKPETYLSFIVPSDTPGTDHHWEMIGHDVVDVSDVEWVAKFAEKIRLAESSDAFRMFDESWLQLSGLLDTLHELPAPKSVGRFAWSHEKQVRRFFSLVSNFLSAGRTYIESTDANLSRKFGKKSTLRRDFQKDCSAEFDAKPGYAVCYHLRNVLVHTGSLPGSLSFLAEESERETIVEYRISRDVLRELYDWNATTRGVIESLPEEIDMLELMRENHESIAKIERHRARRQLAALTADIPRLRGIYDLARMPEGAVPMVATIDDGDPEAITVAHRVIPQESLLDALELAHSEGDVLAAAGVLLGESDSPEGAVAQPGDAGLDSRLEMSRHLALTFLVHGSDSLITEVNDLINSGPNLTARAVIGLVEQCNILARMVNQVTGIPSSRAFG